MSVLRGGYYYSGGADYAIADAVAGLDHGVNRFHKIRYPTETIR